VHSWCGHDASLSHPGCVSRTDRDVPSSSVPDLFHIALPEDWVAAQTAGSYAVSTRGRTLAAEGYIHCSFAEQVAATATRFYGDVEQVVLLRVDPQRLTGAVVVEDLAGTGEAFPHVYGPLDLGAVVEARVARPDELGL
jgi:uncharacterized protein (DUF952 family)